MSNKLSMKLDLSVLILEMEARHELKKMQKIVYENLKPVLDKLFVFCKENNITLENRFEKKDKFIFVKSDYLYFVSLSSAFGPKYLNPKIRVKYSEYNNNYIFEYTYNKKYHVIKDEITDINFNEIIFSQMIGILDILFDN